MNSQYKVWTEEELRIVQNGKTLQEQAAMMPWRKKESIRQMRYLVKKGKAIAPLRSQVLKTDPKENGLAYDGRPVKPYQPIKIAEATPERIKQWGRLNREEIRAMHRERELGYPL